MKLAEAKQQFIASWGAFGSHWGINRTMAQVHALLLISPDNLCTEEIMHQLDISRGNANMNLRELIDWGLIERVVVTGKRKEFFQAEKDIWKVARRIIRERKKRELEPMIKLLGQLSKIEHDKRDRDAKAFTDAVNGLKKLTELTDQSLELAVLGRKSTSFIGSFIRLFK